MKKHLITLSLLCSSLLWAESSPVYPILGSNGKTVSFLIDRIDAESFTGQVDGSTQKITVAWTKVDLVALQKNNPVLWEKRNLAILSTLAEKNFDALSVFKTEIKEFVALTSGSKKSVSVYDYVYDPKTGKLTQKTISQKEHSVSRVQTLFGMMNATAGNSTKGLDVRVGICRTLGITTSEFDRTVVELGTVAASFRVELSKVPNQRTNTDCQKILSRLQTIENYAPKLQTIYGVVDRDAIQKITDAMKELSTY